MYQSGETADQVVRMTLQGIEVAANVALKVGGAASRSFAATLYAIITDNKKRLRKGTAMRNTHQRDAILAYLQSERAHRSATEVYDAVRREIPNISLGTVYRNLGQLVELGKIITVETQDKFVYYDGYAKPHTHFVCRG